MIWDAGTYEVLEGAEASTALKNGSLKFALHGRRLKGAFAMIKLKGPRATGKEWLLMKKTDRFADSAFVLDSALTPTRRKQLKELIPPCQSE